MSCAVGGCKSIKRFKPENVSFHLFPRGIYYPEWLEVLGKAPDLPWSANRFVCSRHFHESDFFYVNNTKRVKSANVPSLNLEPKKYDALDDPLEEMEEDPLSLEPKIISKDICSCGKRCNGRGRASDEQLSRFIYTIHSYSTVLVDYKKKYDEIKQSHTKYRKKWYAAQNTITKLRKQVLSLKLYISQLKNARTKI